EDRRRSAGACFPARNRSSQWQAVHQPHQRPEARLDEAQNQKAHAGRRVVMKLVFCGTPQFAVPSLDKLAAAGFDLRLVVTQPDRPQGRGMELAAPPIKQTALKLGLPVVQPDKIK